jgi:DNA-binding response OmpR family regulator
MGVLMSGEKILDIDDSPTVQRLIEMILSSQGYEVVLASDGEEGIAKARSERPEVILVDFVMPKMNGFQVCKTLKEDPDFKDTPIILVTSKGDKVGSKFVDTLGITEYFTKPFQPEELLAKIREVIDKRKQELAPPPPPPPPPPRDQRRDARTAPAPPAAASSAQHAMGGMEAMVRSIVEQVLAEFIQHTLPELIRKEVAGGRSHQPENAGVQGNLASVRIVEVLQMLGLQRQTGRLVISRSGDGVEVYFKDGTVAFASSNCSGVKSAVEALLRKSCRVDEGSIEHVLSIANMTSQPIDRILAQEKMVDAKTFAECLRRHTESAVFKVMAWKDGEFRFEKAAPPVFANPVHLKVDDLLLEGARRADEWSLIQQKIPHFDIVFEPMIGNAEELTTRGMSDVDLKVFSYVDGRRTIQDIIDTLCMGEFEVVKSMFILLSVNLIRRRR